MTDDIFIMHAFILNKKNQRIFCVGLL